MNASPRALTSRAPSPRSASEMRNRGAPARFSAVGWNCTNSRSATRAPASNPSAMPSPVATAGVGGLAEHLAGTAGGQQCGAGAHLMAAPVGVEVAHAAREAGIDDDLGDERVIDGVDRRQRADAIPEHAADLAAGRVACMQDAADAVRGLAAERQPPSRVEVELRAPLDQLTDVGRTVLDQHADRLFVAEAVAGADRIRRVQRGAVVVAHRRGDAALRVAGVAFGGCRLGEDEDAARGARPMAARRPATPPPTITKSTACVSRTRMLS